MKRIENNNQYCCQSMLNSANDPRIGISYDKTFRYYSINLMGKHAEQKASYCPFCGNKLPKDLWDKYCEVLEKEYNISDFDDKETEKNIPEEFKSDEWWKKRNL